MNAADFRLVLWDVISEDKNNLLETVNDLIKVDDHELAKLAYYTRRILHSKLGIDLLLSRKLTGSLLTRTVSAIALYPEDAIYLIKRYAELTGQSPDDVGGIRRIRDAIKTGLRNAMRRYTTADIISLPEDDYQAFRGLIILLHPKPKNKAQELVFSYVLDNEKPTGKDLVDTIIEGGQLGRIKRSDVLKYPGLLTIKGLQDRITRRKWIGPDLEHTDDYLMLTLVTRNELLIAGLDIQARYLRLLQHSTVIFDVIKPGTLTHAYTQVASPSRKHVYITRDSRRDPVTADLSIIGRSEEPLENVIKRINERNQLVILSDEPVSMHVLEMLEARHGTAVVFSTKYTVADQMPNVIRAPLSAPNIIRIGLYLYEDAVKGYNNFNW